MKKIVYYLLLLLLIKSALLQGQATGKFYVNGTKIIDPNGCQFIAKGANLNGYQTNWKDENKTITDLPLYKNSWKFNYARLYCRILPWNTTNRQPLYDIIKTYIEAHIVVMLTFHDHTGGIFTGTDLDLLISFNEDIINNFKNHPDFTYLWFETMNEPGDKPLNEIDSMNRSFCNAIRNAGAIDNIFCAPGNYWSQEGKNFNSSNVPETTSYILSKGKTFQDWNEIKWNNRNVIFSPHFYRVWAFGDTKMKTFIDDCYAKNLPLIVGEYGIATPGGSTIASTQSMIDIGYQRKIGRCVWHWTGGDENDLTTNNSGRNINITDGNKPTNLTWLGGVTWDDNHALAETCNSIFDNQKPTVPNGLTSVAATTSINLSWNASTDNIGVVGYKVFVNNIENKTTLTNSTTISGLTPNTLYSLTVSAYDAAGNESLKSTSLEQTTLSSALLTSVNDDQFIYSGTWATSTGSAKYMNDDHYSSTTNAYWTYTFYGTQVILYGSLASHHGKASVSIDNGTAIDVSFYSAIRQDQHTIWTSPLFSEGFHTIKVLVSGRKDITSTGYTIMADRLDVINGTSTDTTAPTAPQNLISNYTQNSAVLSWNPSTDNVAVIGYKIYKNSILLNTVTTTSYTATGLTCSQSYSFEVSAIDSAQNESGKTKINGSTIACNGGNLTGLFQVQGKKILHPNGQEFIPFGGNMNGYKWGWSNETSQHVNKLVDEWKFNTIRLNCYIKGYHRTSDYWNNGDFKGTWNVNNNLDKIIQDYTSKGVVVMIDAHDWTGMGIDVSNSNLFNKDGEVMGPNNAETLENPFTELGGKSNYSSQFEILVDFFSYFAEKYKNNPYVWLNPMNEPGTVVDNYYKADKTKLKVVPQYWADMHIQFIQSMRALGFNNPIICDGIATGQDHGQWWGQDPSSVIPHSSAIISKGKEILAADPVKNTIFSFHIYHQWGKPTYPKLMTDFVDTVQNKGLALMIGEAGWYTTKESDEPGIAFHRIFDQNIILGKKVGILSWHLQPGDGMALVNDGTFSKNNHPENPTNLTWSGIEFWKIRNSIPKYGVITDNQTTTTKESIPNEIKGWIENDILKIQNAYGATIFIFDITGKIIYQSIISSTFEEINLQIKNKKFFLVKLVWKDKIKTFKIFMIN